MKAHIAGEVTPELLAFHGEVESWTQEDYERIFGTPEEQEAEWKILRADRAFLHLDWVQEKYAGEWVAAHNCKVLAHAETWQQLRDEMQRIGVWGSDNAVRQMPAR